MREEYSYFVIVQKDEENLAIIGRLETPSGVLNALRQLNSVIIKDLTDNGATDGKLESDLEQLLNAAQTAVFLGTGYNDSTEFKIFVQAERMEFFEDEQEEIEYYRQLTSGQTPS